MSKMIDSRTRPSTVVLEMFQQDNNKYTARIKMSQMGPNDTDLTIAEASNLHNEQEARYFFNKYHFQYGFED